MSNYTEGEILNAAFKVVFEADARDPHGVCLVREPYGAAKWYLKAEWLSRPAYPLPITPGSVIRSDGCFLLLSTSGTWGCPDHTQGVDAHLIAFEVIFDAGAV